MNNSHLQYELNFSHDMNTCSYLPLWIPNTLSKKDELQIERFLVEGFVLRDDLAIEQQKEQVGKDAFLLKKITGEILYLRSNKRLVNQKIKKAQAVLSLYKSKAVADWIKFIKIRETYLTFKQ